MAISKDQLGSDETVILEMRTHGKALIVPAISLFALSSVLGVAIALFPPEWQPWANYAAVGVALILFIWLVLLPFLRWLTSTYTITDRRIITRKGIINKVGHDLPLRRINNVNYERSLTDRMLGCGTLILILLVLMVLLVILSNCSGSQSYGRSSGGSFGGFSTGGGHK